MMNFFIKVNAKKPIVFFFIFINQCVGMMVKLILMSVSSILLELTKNMRVNAKRAIFLIIVKEHDVRMFMSLFVVREIKLSRINVEWNVLKVIY